MSTATVKLGAQAENSSSLADAYQNETKNAAGALLLQSLEIDVTDDAAAASYAPMDLSAWAAALQSNATVTVRIEPSVTKAADLSQKIHTSFLLSGLQANGETKLEDGTRVVTAVKAAVPSHKSVSAPIKLNLNLDMDDDDLVDEDNLLADSSNLLAPPPAMSDAKMDTDDCAGREPCADCTCGRSENKPATTTTTSSGDGHGHDHHGKGQTGSCGKCNLGDAFRCANCPSLGKPAWKAGTEHLVLDLQDDL